MATLGTLRSTETHTTKICYVKVSSAPVQIIVGTPCVSLVQTHPKSTSSDPKKTVLKLTLSANVICQWRFLAK